MPERERAVVSPTGMIHAVRQGSRATACGVDYCRTLFSKSYAHRYWARMQTSFAQLHHQRDGRQVCRRCLENLDAGTGP